MYKYRVNPSGFCFEKKKEKNLLKIYNSCDVMGMCACISLKKVSIICTPGEKGKTKLPFRIFLLESIN